MVRIYKTVAENKLARVKRAKMNRGERLTKVNVHTALEKDEGSAQKQTAAGAFHLARLEKECKRSPVSPPPPPPPLPHCQ